MSSVCGHLPVIRSLPTVASSVCAGVTAYCRGRFCNEADVKPFTTLFSLCGHVEEVPERYLDAITSVSGCGVAFVSIYAIETEYICMLLATTFCIVTVVSRTRQMKKIQALLYNYSKFNL